MTHKKILFVLRSIDLITYYSSLIRSTCKNGFDVYVLLNPNWSGYKITDTIRQLKSNFSNLSFGWSLSRKDFFRPLLFSSREVLSYRRYLIHTDQSPYYLKRWQSYLISPIKFLTQFTVVNWFIKNKLCEELLSGIENLVPPDQNIKASIFSMKPDVVIVAPANLRFDEEIEYLKAAKQLGIPTIIPVMSWDNLTTKGLIHIQPDLFFCWNKTQAKEAIKYHGIKKENIAITGSSFFDKWFTKLKPTAKNTFFKKVGLNPKMQLITYLGSSANIALDETWVIRELITQIRKNNDRFIKSLQIIIRPHPANAKIYKKINQIPGIKIFPKDGTLPASQEDLQVFFDTLYYSVATIGINNSAMIDSVINNKPTIAIILAAYKKTQTEAKHFQDLKNSKALELAYSLDDVTNLILQIKSGIDKKETFRKKFTQDFIRPYSKSAGEIAFEQIYKLAYE